VNPYDNIAEYYDTKYAKFDADLDFYIEMVRRAGANARVLELACGTGRVTLPLLEAGYRVTGLDASEKMLEIARKKAIGFKETARFFQADMRDFDLREQFDFVFIALNSFQHLLNQTEQIDCLNAARKHLAPAGLFILDIQNPEIKEQYPADGRLELDSEFQNPQNGNLVQVFLSATSEPSIQQRHYRYLFDEIEIDNRLRRTTTSFNLRYIYRYEAELLLDKSGFAIEDLYGSYEFDEYNTGSEKLIYVCRRKA